MSPETTISLARGAPSLDIVPVDDLREAARRALEQDPQGAFAYGDAWGYQPLREWIAERQGVDVGRVMATNGSLQADTFLFQHLISPGDAVIVEAPTYDRTLLSLRNMGAELHPIPLEDDGLDVGALEEVLDRGVRPKLAHVIPNFHNPAGRTLSLEKRRRLLELAGEHDFVVFEDDPYIELRFEGDEVPTMLSLDDSDHVVYASSFSKTICPGIRAGYLIGPETMMGEISELATNTYISPSMVGHAIVAEFCRSGAIERSIETVKRALHERRDRLAGALGEHLPDARFVTPEGGYFLWAELSEGADSPALAEAAEEQGVKIVPGTDFLLEGGEDTMRLSYSGVTPDEIDDGVARLASVRSELTGQAA